MSTEQTAPEDFEPTDTTALDAAAGEEAEGAPYSPDGRIAKGVSPHGRAVRPAQAQREAQRAEYKPEPIRSKMGQAAHKRRALGPVDTYTRPDPRDRAMRDAPHEHQVIGDLVEAGNVGSDEPDVPSNAWGREV